MQLPTTDSVKLDEPIASFFLHQTTDPLAFAQLFSEDAVVRDDGGEHRGRAAIAAWNAEAAVAFGVESEPLTAETAGAQSTVIARVSGRFPGSPLQLRFRFTVTRDRISRLEIGS